MSYRLEGDEQERKLFVGGLNKNNTDEDQLKSFFEQYGNIVDCTIMRDGDKQSRGFGFVLFEDSATVDKIISAKKDGANFSIDEHHIEVKRALPKVPGGNAGTSRTGGLYRKVFVGGLPSSATEDDLRRYFECYGRVNEIELLRDRETNRLRGFAFVTFDEEDSADKCIQRRSHEICKKVCEVKRAQTRSNIGKDDDRDGGRGGGRRSYDNEHSSRSSHGADSSSGTLGMNEVNQLIQQAFMMGQQSVYQQPGLQAPTAASLLNGTAGNTAQPNANNILLQALMGQQLAPAAAPPAAPVVAPAAPAAPAGNAALTQLAQLLQGRGIDPNALGALLKEPEAQRPPAATGGKSTSNGGYSTSYPNVSSYDMYSNYSNSAASYGPSKDEDSKRGYRPY